MPYKLTGKNGEVFESEVPGNYGGYRRLIIYGRLDCPSAISNIGKGGYIKHRVFFADEETAKAAGYRPCAKCMKEKHQMWKNSRQKGAKS